MKRKDPSRLLKKAAELFDLPGEALAGIPRVTVTGTERVHIENHRGLLDYGTDEITVNGGGVLIRIKGENMRLGAMSDMELVVMGEITGIFYVS